MPDIIHVDMDCFFAAVEVKDNPDLAGKPVIVGALPGTRGVVAACSYEAREYGVHSAMPVSRAFKKCPHGIYLRPHGNRYVEESEKIRAIFQHYTPLVEPLSLDEAFLDVSGSHRLFGTSVEIGHAIKDRIKTETGLVASVGVAPTKFVAKIASDLEKPDGFVVVNKDEVLDFLRPLDARKIWGVGKATWKKLERLGLKTIGDIADFPAEELERMFGKHGVHLHNLAHGIDARSVEPESERKQVGNEHTFGEDTGDMVEVERTLLALCDKVAGRLYKKGCKGRTVTLKLRDETFRTVTRAHTLDSPVMTAEDIYHIALDLLRNEDLRGLKVRLIGVSVSGFDENCQTSLFDAGSERKEKVEELLDNIRGRFGKGAITRASLIYKRKGKTKE
ncbi:MAG: DNA polymerase IV [Candidatus Latescibacteria bacterium]|nr:DNA polymerase IV [Candidatus Latescibacterota bacterium]